MMEKSKYAKSSSCKGYVYSCKRRNRKQLSLIFRSLIFISIITAGHTITAIYSITAVCSITTIYTIYAVYNITAVYTITIVVTSNFIKSIFIIIIHIHIPFIHIQDII